MQNMPKLLLKYLSAEMSTGIFTSFLPTEDMISFLEFNTFTLNISSDILCVSLNKSSKP